jgi:hypothetical protein
MCTLSFIPEEDGYIVAMNRDERRERASAMPPSIQRNGKLTFLYPSEPGGGTWIGGNSRGNLLALLNWNPTRTQTLGEKLRSRGEIIPKLLLELDTEATKRQLLTLHLAGLYPFRLFGIFPAERQIREWRWDTQRLIAKFHGWERNHWFSSSWSDRRAEAERGGACERTWREDLIDKTVWLRQLHASHIPEPGPYSVCVHREDAATVSYTEVRYAHGNLQMRYRTGNPCQSKESPGLWSIPVLNYLSGSV